MFDIISALVTHLQTKPSDMLLLLATGSTDGLERRFCGLSHAVKTDMKKSLDSPWLGPGLFFGVTIDISVLE